MDNYHVTGGKNRMNQLTKEEKSALGKKAALEKLNPTMPRATHTGILQILDKKIECAVIKMPNGEVKRVISTRSILKVMGRGRPNSRARKMALGADVPVFLSASNLRQFIDFSMKNSMAPIIYKRKTGGKVTSYEYRILTDACEVYLKARDAGALTKDQLDLAKSCEMLMRAFSTVGLVSLIDEVSGYQEVRDRFALQALLDKYLRKEFAEWAKRFPDSFYKQIFRLNNWKFQDIVSKRPAIIGKYTNDIVYSRLLPELVEELEARNPKNEIGYREAKHHQWLNDVGHIDLNAHIRGVTAIMKASDDWKGFKELLDKIYPVKSAKDVLIKD